jgi:hypothetical protein
VGLLLKPLLKKITPIVGQRMLWEVRALEFFILCHKRSKILLLNPTIGCEEIELKV